MRIEADTPFGRDHGDDGILQSTPLCVDQRAGCDEYSADGLFIFPGEWDHVIDAPKDPLDDYVEFLRHDCGVEASFVFGADDLDPQRRAVFAHEAGHGLSIYHPHFIERTVDACGQLMHQNLDVVPFPTDYNATRDIPQIRLHLKR